MKSKVEWFKNIFTEYYSPLCNYAFKITGEYEDSEDIVQTIFTEFWDSDKLDKIENIERYLLRSVKFKSIDYLRNKSRSSKVVLFDIKDAYTKYDNDFEDEDTEALLAYYASKLPPKTRQVFLLSRQHNKTYKEIADEINISVKTVEAQMGRALKHMRNLLKEAGFLSIITHI